VVPLSGITETHFGDEKRSRSMAVTGPAMVAREGARTMHDDPDKKHQEAEAIQEELNKKRLSRRGLLQRLKALGVGFGAAYILGARDAGAAVGTDPSESGAARLKSTDPALNDIIEEGRDPRLSGPKVDRSEWTETAYRRVYFRGYRRVYGRYGRGYARFYGRYGRLYGRYGRIYGRYGRYARFYRRFYRRFV
jgi:hypothetical protein